MERYVNLITKAAGLMFMASLAACEAETGHEPLPDEGRSMRVYTGVQDGGTSPTGEQMNACLIFWRYDSYGIIAGTEEGGWPTKGQGPYLVAKPEEEIDFYKVETGIPYDTETSYPNGSNHVHVVGFAPAALTSDDNYKTLSVPLEMQNGKVDFLSGDGNEQRIGTAENPFDEGTEQEKEQKQLEFCHLTAKILVEARRNPNMSQRIGVKNVKVTLNNVGDEVVKVPVSFRWKNKGNKSGGYYPDKTKDMADGIKLAAIEGDVIMQNIAQKVDSCYVYADGGHSHEDVQTAADGDKITLAMDVEADLVPFRNGDFVDSEAFHKKWENQTVEINSNTGNALRMGYAYKVVITLDVLDIYLQGMEVEWQDGGRHYIPITPTPTEDENKEEGGSEA